jgi:hypothetical protein
MRRLTVLTVLALGVSCAATNGARAAAAAKVDGQVVGPAGSGASYVLSPRGARVAAIANMGSRVVVSVDGVAGPQFDQMLLPDGTPNAAAANTVFTGEAAPVVFSGDGAHYAYAGRLGKEVVVVRDGKEVARAPFNASVLRFGPLAFSPGGRHLYFTLWDQANAAKQFVLDGKVLPFVPADHDAAPVVFSADESRFLYVGADPARPDAPVLVVDGKPAGYVGRDARFTADGKRVVCVGHTGAEPALLVDGKALVGGVQSFHLAPAGGRIAAVATRPNPGGALYHLVVDGQGVAGSECIGGIDRVVFSPDGKRYAARCKGQGAAWMIVDGKKELEYQGIDDDIKFSADSTKLAYVAGNGSQTFVVVNGQESEGYPHILVKPAFSPAGSRLAYVAGQNRLDCNVVVDGKAYPPARRDVSGVVFSPDGSRFLYNFGVDLNNGGLAVDGEEQVGFLAGRAMFSPDGKHLLFVGQDAATGQSGVYVDKQLITPQRGRVTRQAFSPDGRHVYWGTVELRPGRTAVIYADGEEVAAFDADANAALEGMAEAFEVGADGTLTAVAFTPEGVKRLRVTPDDAADVAGMVAAARDAQAQAATDAESAKMKAAEAAAKTKADAEAAQATAKADAMAAREKAVAAKAKAREDAIAKRRKAQEEAAAAKAKAAEERAAARKAKAGKR